jgi:hypothetical protein
MALAAYLELIETRAQSLAMLLVLGFVVGEFLARGPFSTLLRRGCEGPYIWAAARGGY